MTTELTVLGWGCVLALVHIFATINLKTRQYGRAWNMSARDKDMPPPNPIVGRLERAQANFFETFPIVIAAILIVTLTDRTSQWTAIGSMLWLAARIAYLPLYAAGIPRIRTLIFALSMAGLLMILWPALGF